MTKILVTGGCGFLGQHLVQELAKKNVSIDIIDLNCPDNIEFPQGVNVHTGVDLCQFEQIEPYVKNKDVVIHLAGIVSFSIKDKDLLYNVNTVGTENVCKAMSQNDVKSLIHISSVAALGYNNDKDNPIDEDFLFDWNIAHKRKKYYMISKYNADKVIKSYDSINATILYPGLMFGPGDRTNAPKLINAIKKNRIPFNMPGGTNIIDVRDVVQGILAVLDKQITNEHILLSGHNISFKELNSVIAKVVNTQPPKKTVPVIANGLLFNILLSCERLSNKKLQLTADNVDSAFKFRYFKNNKAKYLLDWTTTISFENSIIDTVAWMEENGLSDW